MIDLSSPLWSRYVTGAKAFDTLYSQGERCPSNTTGARCTCQRTPVRQICKVFKRVEEIAGELGAELLPRFK